MNKFVNVFNESKVEKVVKIDSDTQKILSPVKNEFLIAGGLKGIFDYESQSVKVALPDINFVLNEDDFGAIHGKLNIRLNGVQSKSICKGEKIKATFTKVENVTFEIWYNKELHKIEFTSDMQEKNLSYYTENNARITNK